MSSATVSADPGRRPFRQRLAGGAAAFARRLGLARFRRDRRGATAVEFALVSLPFFALLFAILESALLFFATQAIETAVSQGGRLIRTGQAQTADFGVDDVRSAMCDAIFQLLACEDKLKVEVKVYPNFADIDTSLPLDDDGNLEDEFDYVDGGPGDIVVVRAFYEWPIYTNLLGLGLGTMPNGSHLITATTAFRNEPY